MMAPACWQAREGWHPCSQVAHGPEQNSRAAHLFGCVSLAVPGTSSNGERLVRCTVKEAYLTATALASQAMGRGVWLTGSPSSCTQCWRASGLLRCLPGPVTLASGLSSSSLGKWEVHPDGSDQTSKGVALLCSALLSKATGNWRARGHGYEWPQHCPLCTKNEIAFCLKMQTPSSWMLQLFKESTKVQNTV